MSAPLTLEAISLAKSFGQRPVLSNVRFRCEAGKSYCVLGPNGSGKSTLLKLLLGLIDADTGELLYCKKAYSYQSIAILKNFGYAPAKENCLVPNATVYENLRFFAKISQNAHHISKAITDILAKLKIVQIRDVPFQDLSTGFKKKAGIAKAFIGMPKIVLLDEPFASLDRNACDLVSAFISQYISQQQAICILTTNRDEIAQLYENKIFLDSTTTSS